MIREARAADNSAVFRLCQQLDMINPPADRDDFDVSFFHILRSRGEGRDVLLVAEDDAAQVVGYAYLTVSRLLYAGGLSAHLEELVVDANARGAGVGSDLVLACERVCTDRGVGQLTMSTRRAGAFYGRLGYEPHGGVLQEALPAAADPLSGPGAERPAEQPRRRAALTDPLSSPGRRTTRLTR